MRPSSLPFLDKCPCWESDQGTGEQYKDAGTARHEYLTALLTHGGTAGENLSEEDRAAVEWAADYIKCKAPMSDHPMRLEYHVNPLGPDFKPIFPKGGTLDVACGPVLFDLKARERNYEAQMAAYALGMFQQDGWQEVEVHLLFSETKRAQVFKLNEEGAEAIVNRITASVADPNRKPKLCEYCGWCALRLTCPAKLEVANAVIAGREDWKLEQWHSSKIETAEEMGKALRVARQLSDWCESVEHHAKEMALKKGMVPTGFEMKPKSGKSYVPETVAAFPLIGIPQTEFLKACQLRLNTSKKYPDQIGIINVYADFNKLKLATAKKEVVRKLGDALKKTKDSIYLKAVGATEEESQE